MMRTILVPTDLSASANNALEYAIKLAQKTNGQLMLANFELTEAAEVLAESENFQYRHTPEILEEMSESIQKTFSVPCDFMVERTSQTLQKTIGTLSLKPDLIVMGTNGAEDLYQYFGGTNTYRVIKKTKCPVLVIPENVSYKAIEKIVFALDYAHNNELAFLQLNNLLEPYHPEMVFLQISQEKTPISNDVFQALKEKIYSCFSKSESIRFDRTFSRDPENFPERLNKYIEDIHADLLVVTHYDRGIVSNIFHRSITRKLSEATTYPLLVLHV